jgi:hypothetical protein
LLRLSPHMSLKADLELKGLRALQRHPWFVNILNAQTLTIIKEDLPICKL